MSHEQVHRGLRQFHARHSMLATAHLHEMLDEDRNVFEPFTKRRHADPDDVQAEVQVIAERSRTGLQLKIAVGRRDEPSVDLGVGTVGADALNFSGFEKSQEHHLHAHAHFADFVEEDGAVLRHLQESGLITIGTREASAHMPEELGFEQRIGYARTVHRDEGAGGTRAHLMNQPRHDLFPDAGFPGDQYFGVRARGAVDVLLDEANGLAASEECKFMRG